VLGDLQGPPDRPLRWTPPPAGSFTPGEKKALEDIKNFLPYKAYRPIDSAYVIGLNGPHLFLKDWDGQKHELFMHVTPVNLANPTVFTVDALRFWDVAPSDPQKAPALLIDTWFKIDLGETVVVGTSRLDGGRALILLVTAAPTEASGSD
jgi:hypothetical protein